VDVEARIELIRDLCSFEGRAAGTDSERRAANWLAERLRSEGGRRVTVEPTYVHPQAVLVEALHCAIAFAGSLAAIPSPPIGFGLVLIAATSMYFDLNARFYVLRRLFFRRASQNVVARGRRRGAGATIILTAHLDAGRTGTLYRPRAIRWLSRLGRLIGVPVGPFRPLFWSVAILLPILGARLAGVDNNFLSILQIIPTLTLLVGCFLLVDVQLSEVVPGANDNASGVATAIALAGALAEDHPRNLDVWIVLVGGEESLNEGMRAFVRTHREDLDRDSTYVINLDDVGAGDVRYHVSEGLAVSFALDRRLIELCEAIATADRDDGNRYRARPFASGFATAAVPARLSGLRATTISALEPDRLVPSRFHLPDDVPDAIDPEALARVHDFALELIRQLDRDAGRRRAPRDEPSAVI
jgi:hypothetical protein